MTKPGCAFAAFFFYEEGIGAMVKKKELDENTTPIQIIHLYNSLENWVLEKLHVCGKYISNIIFDRKPKWSVWSIRTTFMRYLSK